MREKEYQQGFYRPRYPDKYKGDLRNIVFRSTWELKMFKYCDLTDTVLEWSSEDIVVPYKNPITGEYHRYFVDIYLKHKTPNGQIKKKLIEIKPSKYCKPPMIPKKKTKKYIKEAETFLINQSKWHAAQEYAKKKGMDFLIFTEKELGIH